MGDGLLPLNLLVLGLVVVILFFPSNIVRIILGLPFLLFFPGYTLMVALFPKRNGMGGVNRIALSFGMSIAVVPLMGIILNYTAWGIRLEPVLCSTVLFIFITSIVGWLRRKRLTEQERFDIEFQLIVLGWGGGMLDRVLSILLAVAIVGTLGTLGYVITKPKGGERFTEFYILGPEGRAEGYPKELVAGEEAKVIVTIVNREHEALSYRLEIIIDGARHSEIGPVVLHHEERWEREIGFVPAQSGDNQKLEFLLYKQGQSEVYQSLHLWVNVKK